MADDGADKTEEPTGKRLSKAEEDGDVPMSREVGHLLMLLAIMVAMGTMAPWITTDLIYLLRAFIERPHVMLTDIEAIRDLTIQMIWRVGVLLAMPIGLFMIIGVLSTLGQVGFLYTPKKLQPKLSNLSIIAGVKRLFSSQSLVEAAKSIAKIVVLVIVIATMVVPALRHPDQIIDQDLMTTVSQAHTLIILLLFFVSITMIVIAGADITYTRWSHKEKLKMTKQEVRDEHKDMEGDPKVKGRIRAIRLERHKKRMMAAVPKATVIITNPTHFAVALKYDMDSMAAPTVVAKGADYLALRIRQIADQHEVPIVENPPLARALYAVVEVDQEIPAEHYKAVAEVIGFVMRLKGKLLAK